MLGMVLGFWYMAETPKSRLVYIEVAIMGWTIEKLPATLRVKLTT